jgi:hypothetical protein
MPVRRPVPEAQILSGPEQSALRLIADLGVDCLKKPDRQFHQNLRKLQ